MLAEDRRQLIKDLVFEKKAVKVTELAKQFSVTDENKTKVEFKNG